MEGIPSCATDVENVKHNKHKYTIINVDRHTYLINARTLTVQSALLFLLLEQTINIYLNTISESHDI